MGLHLKTAAGLLLLVQALHLASLQRSTDSPRRTIAKSWLRELAKNKTVSQNTALPGEEPEYDQRAEAAAESSSDYSIASGSLAIFTEEEENVNGQDKNTNEGSGDESSIAITEPPTVQNVTSSTAELPEVEVSPTTAGVDGVTDTTEVTHNTTAAPQSSSGDLSAQNSTSVDNHTNHINLTNPMTTSAPEDKVTEQSTTKTDPKTPLANVTQTTDTSTTVPDISETNGTSSFFTSAEGSISASASASTSASPSTSASASASPSASASSSTSASPSTSASASASPSTSAFASPDLNTPEMANKTGKGSAEGSSSDRGLESDSGNSKKRYWGLVLGSMVAVGCVVAVTYVLLKRRYRKDFSHRKLVEEYPSEPVLRLDNCEPLDLTLGRLSYYNPALQGDNIQMSSLHERN